MGNNLNSNQKFKVIFALLELELDDVAELDPPVALAFVSTFGTGLKFIVF